MASPVPRSVVDKWDLWWEGKNTKPIAYSLYKKGPVDYSPVVKPWMDPMYTQKWCYWQQEFVFGHAVELTWKTGDWRYVEEALDFLEYYTRFAGHLMQGYSFILPGLGPNVGAAFITNFTQYGKGTIWFDLETPWELSRIPALRDDGTVSYYEIVRIAFKKLVKRLNEKYVIAMFNISEPFDVLSSIRQPGNCALDTLMDPDTLKAAIAKLEKLFLRFWHEFGEMLDPNNHGCYCQNMRYLSSKPTHVCQCDFSALIGPDAFEEFVLGTVRNHCNRFNGRVTFHLDGVGEIPHVEKLLTIDNLHSIQWVNGAGKPDCLDECWYDMYKQIIDAGKRICLTSVPYSVDAFRKFFGIFPAEMFAVSLVFEDKKEAEPWMPLFEE